MFTINDFKVELKNPEEVKNFVKRHGEFSKVCYDTPKEKAEQVGKHCLQSGHFSGSRHLFMVFELKCVPRSCYDEETEILTLEGWKLIKDIKKGDKVLSASGKGNINEGIVESTKQKEYEGKIIKIITKPSSKLDVVELLETTIIIAEHIANVPICTISIGEKGGLSRICGEFFGSCMTYGVNRKKSAPGQPNIEDLSNLLKLIHKNIEA